MNTGIAERPKKKLFAVAYERKIGPRKWVGEMEYLHATDIGEARVAWFRSESNATRIMQAERRAIRFVGISEVIGYFVEDNHGDVLSV